MNDQRESTRQFLREYLLELPSRHAFRITRQMKKDLRNTIDTFTLLTPRDMRPEVDNHYHVGRQCSRVFLKGETCYRCFTCAYDETCSLCAYCFNPDSHRGHDVYKSIIQRDNSGCCDCGDLEAYLHPHCEYYSGEGLSNDPDDPISAVTQQFGDNFEDVFSVLVDYVVDVESKAVSCLVSPPDVSGVVTMSEAAGLSSLVYGSRDINSRQYALVLYNDQLHQFQDAVQRVRFASGKTTEFADMIVRRCEERGSAIVMISDNVSLLMHRRAKLTSTGLIACIRSTRDVFRETMCDEIIAWMLELSKSAIMERSIDLRNRFARVLLSRHFYGGDTRPIATSKEGVQMGPGELRYIPFQDEYRPPTLAWDIPQEIKEECEYEDLPLVLPRNGKYNFVASRLQFLFYYDIRMCRLSREQIHGVVIELLLNNSRYKMMVTAQFLDIYDDLLALFVSYDREPEVSVMPILTTQLLTCATSCVAVLRHGDEYRMIRAVDNYLRMGSTSSTVRTPYSLNSDDLYSPALKNRKWGHVFMDLNYLITRNPDPRCTIYFFETFPKTVHMLSLLQSRPTFKREAVKHVEYEFTEYPFYFNATSVMSHFPESIGKVLNRLDESLLTIPDGGFASDMLYNPLIAKLIEMAFHGPQNTLCDLGDEAAKKIVQSRELPIVFSREIFADKNIHRFVNFDVLSGEVSFLHPVHSTFAWLLEMDRTISSRDRIRRILDVIDKGTVQCVPGAEIGDGVKGVFDIPLRTLVLLSQIKVGLWVRNGASVRAQMMTYRFYGMRECGFTKDLFLTQVFCAFEPPEDAMGTLIRRWGLREWCEGHFSECQYGPQHAPEMAEEFVLLLINVLTSDFHLHKRMAQDESDMLLQLEVIHTLCFKPLTYSQIIAEVPDYMCSEKRFFIAFEKCAEEVPSTNRAETTRELKMYRLKEELYSLVDPFYVFYSSNKREDCIKLIKDRIRKNVLKKPKMPLDRVVLPPRVVSWDNSPYSRLVDLTCSYGFLSFIEQTLRFCTDEAARRADRLVIDETEYNTDGLLEMTLHLLHIAVTQHNCNYFLVDYLAQSPIPQMLYDMLNDEVYLALAPKVRAILHIFCHLAPIGEEQVLAAIPNYDEDLMIPQSHDTLLASQERKKRHAQKKKDKILARIRRQQQKFAEVNRVDLETEEGAGDDDDASEGNAAMYDDDSEEEKGVWKFPEQRCILCQMAPESSDEPFGIFSYIAESNEFRTVPCEDPYWFYKAFSGNASSDVKSTPRSMLRDHLAELEETRVIGPGFSGDENTNYSENHSVVTSCCHGMHFSCYMNYIKSLKTRQTSQITRTMPEDLQKLEFLCPLCKSVNNVFVPIVYATNDGRFDEEFRQPIIIDDVQKYFGSSSFDRQLSSIVGDDKSVFERVREELVATVHSKVKPGYWFLRDGDTAVDKKCKTYQAISQSLEGMSQLLSPFDDVSAVICSTIESVEISLRGMAYDEDSVIMHSIDAPKVPLVCAQLSTQAVTFLRTWCQLRDLVRCTTSRDCPKQLVGLLRSICTADDLVYDGEDFFKLLVSVEPLKTFGISFQTLLAICYLRHVRQALLQVMTVLEHNSRKLDGRLMAGLADLSLPAEDCELLGTALANFMGQPGLTQAARSATANIVYSMVVRLVTPFVRRATIYAYVRFANLQPDRLPSFTGDELESDKLCGVLGLPTVAELLHGMDASAFFGVGPAEKARLYSAKVAYPGPIELISLPAKINTFFIRFCDKLDKTQQPLDPAVCLYCGAVLDMQRTNYGDRYGCCNMHVEWECVDSDGLGMFLVPRSNCVLLLGNKKGTFIASPYINSHGESESDSKKGGHDLHLSHRRYEEICRTIWLEHNIQNRISRQMESQPDVGGWQTL